MLILFSDHLILFGTPTLIYLLSFLSTAIPHVTSQVHVQECFPCLGMRPVPMPSAVLPFRPHSPLSPNTMRLRSCEVDGSQLQVREGERRGNFQGERKAMRSCVLILPQHPVGCSLRIWATRQRVMCLHPRHVIM